MIIMPCQGNNAVGALRCSQISFNKNRIYRVKLQLFSQIFQIIVFAFRSEIFKNFKRKYEELSSKIHVSSGKIWQLSNVHAAFFSHAAQQNQTTFCKQVLFPVQLKNNVCTTSFPTHTNEPEFLYSQSPQQEDSEYTVNIYKNVQK